MGPKGGRGHHRRSPAAGLAHAQARRAVHQHHLAVAQEVKVVNDVGVVLVRFTHVHQTAPNVLRGLVSGKQFVHRMSKWTVVLGTVGVLTQDSLVDQRVVENLLTGMSTFTVFPIVTVYH